MSSLTPTERALLKEQLLNQAALNALQDVFFLIGEDRRLIRWNERMEEVTGLAPSELAGIDAYDLLNGVAREEVYAAIDRAREDFATLQAELVSRDGSSIPYEFNAATLTSPEGHVIGIVGTGRDLSEQRRFEQALRESEERWRRLVENHPDPILLAQDGRLVYANPALVRLLDAETADEVEGQPLTRFVAEEDHEQLRERTGAVLTGTTHHELVEYTLVTLRGQRRVVEATGVPATYRGRPAVQALLRDVTELRAAQREKEQYAERLQNLSHQLVRVQEEERRHLARELHDEIGQELTALKLALDTSRKNTDGPVRELIEEGCSLVRQLQRKVRALSLDLRPPLLDDLGLVPALRWLIERYEQHAGVHVAFRHAALPELSHDLRTTVFRIIQEALTNVARHAQAKEVRVQLAVEGNALRVEITDEGVGFDLTEVELQNHTVGLSGMRERAALQGGTLEIDTADGSGTCVRARLPLDSSVHHLDPEHP